MTISQTQLVDILYKKLSGVSKTDIDTAKSPANEANASPQLSPGTTIWQQDYNIPSVTTLPTGNSSVVTVYRDTLSSTVQTVLLSESTAQATWATNLTDWISPQFGAGYQIKLYAGPPGKSNPQTLIFLPVGGSSNQDSWYFDYSAGIVNFADTNVPTAVANVANVVYVVGARYTGVKGINNFANLQIANITINGNTITGNTGVTFGGNITTGNISGNLYGNLIGTVYGNSIGTTATYTGNITAANANIDNLYVTNLEIDQGNVTAANVNSTIHGNIFGTTANFVGNISTTGNLITNGFFWANGVPIVFSNYSNSNVASYFLSNTISSNINITGNISTIANINAGYFIGNAAYLYGLPPVYGNSNVATFLSNLGSNTVTTTGNITAGYFIGNAAYLYGLPPTYGNTDVENFLAHFGSNVITTTGNISGNVNTDIITPYQTSITVFNSNTAIGLPSGDTRTRPSSPVGGYTRYNTDTGSIEYWDGSSWITIVKGIVDQIITPDGINNSFALIQPTTTVGVLVSINGTVQRPGTYVVSGTNIIFTETPMVTDIIDIRFLGAAITTTYGDTNVTSYLATGLDPTINAMNANLTAFEAYAINTFGTSSYSNASVASYLPVYSGTISVNEIVIAGNSTIQQGTNLPGDLEISTPSGNGILYLSDADATTRSVLQAPGVVEIITNSVNSPLTWTFGTDGTLTFPDGSIVINGFISGATGSAGGITNGGTGYQQFFAQGDGAYVQTSVGNAGTTFNTWRFGLDGTLTLPAGGMVNYANGTSILNGITASTSAAFPAWSNVGSITITGTTSNPTKGTSSQDNISYRQLGTKEWEIILTYCQTATNGATGNGDYLITLPNSLSFDTTLPSQQVYTGNIGANNWALASYIIPSGSGLLTNGTVGGQAYPIIFNATQFRILTTTYGGLTSNTIQCWGSGFYSMTDQPTVQLTFRFTST